MYRSRPLSPAASDAILRARAVNAEREAQAESAAQRAQGLCDCGLAHLPGEHRCAACKIADARKGRALFDRL